MKAIILAAGKATRLLPLTKNMPQSMLKIGKKTILEMQIQNIKKSGIKDIIVVTGHISEKLEKFCEKLGIKTIFNPFYNLSGTALSLWIAKEEMKGGFLFLYSDVLFSPNIINGMLKFNGDICLAIKKGEFREEAEKVSEVDGKIKKISKIHENKENGEFIGIAKFLDNGAKKLTEELQNVVKKDLNTSFIELIDNLIKKGEIVTVYDIKDSQFIDIDFPEDLKKAGKIFK